MFRQSPTRWDFTIFFFLLAIMRYIRSSRGPACSFMASCCRDSSSLSSCIWSRSCSNSWSRLLVTYTERLFLVSTLKKMLNTTLLVRTRLILLFFLLSPTFSIMLLWAHLFLLYFVSESLLLLEAEVRKLPLMQSCHELFHKKLQQLECLTCSSCSRLSWSSSLWRNCSSNEARSPV